jgi:hypothetical protein
LNNGKTLGLPGWLLGLSGLAGLLLLWWLGVKVFGSADGLSARFSLSATLASLWELLGRSELYLNIAVSLKRIFVGLFLALLIGVPLGLLVGSSRKLEDYAGVPVSADDLAVVVDAHRGDADGRGRPADLLPAGVRSGVADSAEYGGGCASA